MDGTYAFEPSGQRYSTSRHLPSWNHLGLVPTLGATVLQHTGVNLKPYTSGCYSAIARVSRSAPTVALLFLESAAELPSGSSIDHGFVTIAGCSSDISNLG